jgi:glycosyltransferase involved in cell wall biosynthesis
MKQVAIVVQRYGEEVLGGAEMLASVFAKALHPYCEINVLTTTAIDYISWRSHYRAGESHEEGIRILRFPPDFERTQYFNELHSIFLKGISLDDFIKTPSNQKKLWQEYISKIPVSFQEELIKWQGPFPSSLFNYIKENELNYDKFIFFTYLYPTTYFGVRCINNIEKIFIYPTLHNEPIAYLSILRRYRENSLLFLTEEELNLANTLWGEVKGIVVGYGIEDKVMHLKSTIEPVKEQYLLYAGRIDQAKGVHLLIEDFNKYKQEHPGNTVKLKLIGRLAMDLHLNGNKDIELVGFVSEEEKFRLMGEAMALVLPSFNESLSIVVLEAFMLSTPVIVNGHCDVLSGHIKRSYGGFAYYNYTDFKKAINSLLDNYELGIELGINGRKYFCDNFEWTKYQARLLEALDLNAD